MCLSPGFILFILAPAFLAHFLCSKGNLVLVRWAEGMVLGRALKEGMADRQFGWKPEEPSHFPSRHKFWSPSTFLCPNSTKGDFTSSCVFSKLAPIASKHRLGRETLQSPVLAFVRETHLGTFAMSLSFLCLSFPTIQWGQPTAVFPSGSV